jgi:hypothetical protein
LSSLQSLLSGKEVIVQKSHQKSLLLLSRQLLNVGFERLFLGFSSNSSAIDVAVTLSSAFAATRAFIYNRFLMFHCCLSTAKTRSCKSCFCLGIRPFFATSGGKL